MPLFRLLKFCTVAEICTFSVDRVTLALNGETYLSQFSGRSFRQTPVYSPTAFTVIIINVTQKSIKFLPIHGYQRAGGRLKCEAHKSS